MRGRGLYYINFNTSQLNTKYFILSSTHPRETPTGVSSYITQPQTITYNTSMALTSSLWIAKGTLSFSLIGQDSLARSSLCHVAS